MAAPTLTTEAATGAAPGSVTLNGDLTNDGGAATQTKFEYGLTAAYGSVTALATTAVGAFSAIVSGLLPNTTYHFRAVGVNVDGTTNGADRTFVLATRQAVPERYIGASTDTKPASAPVGSRCYETDTGDEYITRDGTTWVLYHGE